MSHANLDDIRRSHLCQFNGLGCGKEDTCVLSEDRGKNHCAIYQYLAYLTKEFTK